MSGAFFQTKKYCLCFDWYSFSVCVCV